MFCFDDWHKVFSLEMLSGTTPLAAKMFPVLCGHDQMQGYLVECEFHFALTALLESDGCREWNGASSSRETVNYILV